MAIETVPGRRQAAGRQQTQHACSTAEERAARLLPCRSYRQCLHHWNQQTGCASIAQELPRILGSRGAPGRSLR
jgi:hypothetical protein